MLARADCYASTRCAIAPRAGPRSLRRVSGRADYNPFNLLIASREATFVAYNRVERIEVVQLKPGFHLLTNLDVNDFECPRISASYEKFATLGKDAGFRRDPILRRAELQRLLADHNTQLDPRSGPPSDLHAPRRLCNALVEPDFSWP